MPEFEQFYDLGLHHVLNKTGYDHFIFVVALFVLYQVDDWKRVLVLLTAFTVGHSVALFIASFSDAHLPSEWLKYGIPLVIFVAAVFNLFTRSENPTVNIRNYLFGSVFSLFHGLDYAHYLKTQLGESTLVPLFAYNLGMEVGQIIVVVCLLIVGFLLVSIVNVSRRDWKMVVSSAVAGMAVVLILKSGFL